MTTTLNPYWQAVEDEERMLRTARPQSAERVVTILREVDPQEPGTYSGEAFYSGANADHDLADILSVAGWEVEYLDGDYYWIASHPATGDRLRYCEGGVDANPSD